MKDYKWKSSVSDLIQQYIDFKHISGMKFENQERWLQHFDHFFYYNGHEGRAITKEILFPFLYEQSGSVSVKCAKETLFCDFARFLSNRGYHAFILTPRYTLPKSRCTHSVDIFRRYRRKTWRIFSL